MVTSEASSPAWVELGLELLIPEANVLFRGPNLMG